MTRDEVAKLEKYLQKLFGLKTIRVTGRPKQKDSAEVYIGDEFVGVLYRDDEDEDLSYQFQMSILDFDLSS